jgi:hypothetical protein
LLDSLLDDLRENYSLALVPHGPRATRDALLDLEDCLAVRDRSDAMHAVFRLDPQRTRALLASELGVAGACCRNVALEEMFIELLGGQL